MGRAFIANGRWQGPPETACDARAQQKATLRVSALAGVLTLALIAGPGLGSGLPEEERPSGPAVAMPQMISAKAADRVPTLDERASALRRRPRPDAESAAEAAAPPAAEPRAPIEVIDAATLKAGSMVVRIAGIAPPAADRHCRRLDGLAVPCADRAESYLGLLVRGRAVACDRAGFAADGVERGRCRIGEADIAEQMVRQGWAEAADRDEPRLAVAEAQARKQKLGIWRD
jgi:endonuclease YncB( thermonuclease family)